MKAIFQGQIIAESDQTVEVEGNHYFPPERIDRKYLRPSDLHSTCPWKGQADYFHLAVDGHMVPDGVWVYPDTSEEAQSFEGYFAFYTNKGIEIVE